MKIIVLLLLLLFVSFSSIAQLNLDSLSGIWENEKNHDTIRLNALKVISWDGFLFSQPDSAFYFAQQQYDFAEKKGQKKWMADALNTQGASFTLRADYANALLTYQKSLAINTEIGNQRGLGVAYGNIGSSYQKMGDLDQALVAQLKSKSIKLELNDELGLGKTLTNIGNIYQIQGNYGEAIENYMQSLKLKEKLNDDRGIGNVLNNLGSVYQGMNEWDMAIQFYKKSLEYKRKIDDQKGISNSLLNLGMAYESKKVIDTAMNYYQESLALKNIINDNYGKSIALNNIGSLLLDEGKYEEALDFFEQGLAIRKAIEDQQGIANSLNNLARVYFYRNDLAKALQIAKESLQIAQETGAVFETKEASFTLWEINRKLGKYKESLAMYELYIQSRDSMNSEENQKEVIRQTYKYEYEKKATADSIQTSEQNKVKDAQLLAQQAENRQQAQQKYFLFAGLALALLFGIFIFNRFRVTNRQKGVIENQKKQVDLAFAELEEKNTEILDSINYAKRIQSAILPPLKDVKDCLPNSFILYKPKDIVAGDFYWLERKVDKILIAACDCTGHGVPGAMVSVVCNNGLNRSVREYNLTDPGKILDKTREIVIQEFEKSEEDVKDGMDIALCTLEGKKLKYAGANNPLWIKRKDKAEIEEIKADKQPIGKYSTPLPYTTHSVELNTGDTVYLFSDGFSDQFGGEKGKKFKSTNFKQLLCEIQNESMEQQKEILNQTFEDWKGTLSQVDDVCVIGIRI